VQTIILKENVIRKQTFKHVHQYNHPGSSGAGLSSDVTSKRQHIKYI